MRAQPRVGWYFPVTPATFAAATRNWPLNGRAPRLLRNPERSDAAKRPLVRLRPEKDVTLFSLPVEIDVAIGERATLQALQVVARWKDEPSPNSNDRFRAIVVYLVDETTRLRVIDQLIKVSRGKFGAGEGLATSMKGRISRRDTIVLAELRLD